MERRQPRPSVQEDDRAPLGFPLCPNRDDADHRAIVRSRRVRFREIVCVGSYWFHADHRSPFSLQLPLLLLAALVLVVAVPAFGKSDELAPGGAATVVEVVDGDTLRIDDGEQVRPLGLQAPIAARATKFQDMAAR